MKVGGAEENMGSVQKFVTNTFPTSHLKEQHNNQLVVSASVFFHLLQINLFHFLLNNN